MARAKTSIHRGPGHSRRGPVGCLSREDASAAQRRRARPTSRFASIIRYKKGEEIYCEGHRANAVFNIISGVGKAYKTPPMAANISLRSCFRMICPDYPKKEGA